MDTVLALLPVRIPRGRLDGAVVELSQDAEGVITAEVRIPAPSPAIAPAA